MHDEHQDDDEDDEPHSDYPEWWALDSERRTDASPQAFEAAANNPGGWSLRSMQFFRAALIMWRADREHNERTQRRAPDEPRALELADMMPVTLTLAAVAIENILKSLLAQRGEAAANGKLTKRAATHELTDLATSADVSLDGREIELLRHLTYFARGEGRFPTARSSADGVATMLSISGSFPADLASVYFRLTDTLCERAGDSPSHAHLFHQLKIFAHVLPPRQ